MMLIKCSVDDKIIMYGEMEWLGADNCRGLF